MQDYSAAPFWAISSIGYGKGFTIDEAVENHDRIVKRDHGKHLAVKVSEISLLVWKPSRAVDGFVLDGAVRWYVGDDYFEADVDEIVAERAQPDAWHKHVAKSGAEYVSL